MPRGPVAARDLAFVARGGEMAPRSSPSCAPRCWLLLLGDRAARCSCAGCRGTRILPPEGCRSLAVLRQVHPHSLLRRRNYTGKCKSFPAPSLHSPLKQTLESNRVLSADRVQISLLPNYAQEVDESRVWRLHGLLVLRSP